MTRCPSRGHLRVEAAQERHARCRRWTPARPGAVGLLVVLGREPLGEEVDQVGEVADRRDRRRPRAGKRRSATTRSKSERGAFGRRREHDRARLALERVGPARELDAHSLLDEADLGAGVLLLGEAEAQQALRG